MSVVWIWCTARERAFQFSWCMLELFFPEPCCPFVRVLQSIFWTGSSDHLCTGLCIRSHGWSRAMGLLIFVFTCMGETAMQSVTCKKEPGICLGYRDAPLSLETCSLNGHALAHSLSLSLSLSPSLPPSLPRSLARSLSLSLSLALSLSPSLPLSLSPSLEFSQDWAGPGESSICAMLQSCKTWICVAGGACNRPMQVESHVPWVYECKIPWRGQPQRKLAPDLFKNSLLIPAWKTSFFDRFFATMGPDRFRPSTLPQCIYVCVSIRMRVCILVSSVGVGSVGWVVGRLVFK